MAEVYTSNQTLGGSGTSGGYALADFVLDRVSSTLIEGSSASLGDRQWRTSGYFGDD